MKGEKERNWPSGGEKMFGGMETGLYASSCDRWWGSKVNNDNAKEEMGRDSID